MAVTLPRWPSRRRGIAAHGLAGSTARVATKMSVLIFVVVIMILNTENNSNNTSHNSNSRGFERQDAAKH